MKITSNEDGNIELKEVYNTIVLKTDSGETLAICMRDSGFEFKYEGRWYSAKGGVVNNLKPLIDKKMEYELTQDCRFGPKGKVVGYAVYHYDATVEERRTLFKEVGGVNASRTVTSSYNAADSHQYRDEPLPVWTDGDATSSVSSSNSLAEDTVEFGGGSFGGGGASSEYEDSGYGGSDDDSGSDGGDCDGGSDD